MQSLLSEVDAAVCEHSRVRHFWYTLKNTGLNITQRWVKNGQTQRLGYFDPAFGRGLKSWGQNVKVLPYVYSTNELSS